MAEQNPGMPDVPALDPQPEDLEVVQQGTKRAQPCADTPAPAPAPGAVTAEEAAARAESPSAKRQRVDGAFAPAHQQDSPSGQLLATLAPRTQHLPPHALASNDSLSYQQPPGDTCKQQPRPKHTQHQGPQSFQQQDPQQTHAQQQMPQGEQQPAEMLQPPTSSLSGGALGQNLQPVPGWPFAVLPHSMCAAQDPHSSFSQPAHQPHTMHVSMSAAASLAASAAAAACAAMAAFGMKTGDPNVPAAWTAAAADAAAAAVAAVQELLHQGKQQQQPQPQPSQIGHSQQTQQQLPPSNSTLGGALGQLQSTPSSLLLPRSMPAAQDPHNSFSQPADQLQAITGPVSSVAGLLSQHEVAADIAAAAASLGEHAEEARAAAVHPLIGHPMCELVDDPSLDLLRFSKQQLGGCRWQAGQELRLQRRTLKGGIELKDYTGLEGYDLETENEGQQLEELLLLRVERLRGFGATGEVYDVQVLQHTLAAAPDATQAAGDTSLALAATAGAASSAAAAVGDAAAHNASAGDAAAGGAVARDAAARDAATAAADSLEGHTLSLKVCRHYSQVPDIVQDIAYRRDMGRYLDDMQSSMAKHHRIMSALGRPSYNIVHSHMCGSICEANGSRVPALLMDRASGVSLDFKLQQVAKQAPGVPRLGKKLTHRVVADVLNGLFHLHDEGWAYLDLKPGNIVSLNVCFKGQPAGAQMNYSLVDFGSSQHVGKDGSRTLERVAGTPPYMSPERLNTSLRSCKADIWSLGMLVINLRLGRVPVASELKGLTAEATHQATLQAMQHAPRYQSLTAAEWAFIERCLAFDPKQRPTAWELIDDDEYILDGAD